MPPTDGDAALLLIQVADPSPNGNRAMNRLLPIAIASVLAASASNAFAQTEVERHDRLLIERAELAESVPHPTRGMSMNQVESRFGAPSQKHAPVGGDKPQHPPITRWVYPSFSVYFEHSHVINTVLNRASASERGPVPVN